MAKVVFKGKGDRLPSIRYIPKNGPTLRCVEMSDRHLEVAIKLMCDMLGHKLMLYEMKAILTPYKDRARINFDEPGDPKPNMHYRWRALLLFRAEQRRRERKYGGSNNTMDRSHDGFAQDVANQGREIDAHQGYG